MIKLLVIGNRTNYDFYDILIIKHAISEGLQYFRNLLIK